MKQMNKFTQFDAITFSEKVELMAMKSEILKDFETKDEIGAKYTIVVWSDYHDYGDTDVTNVGETFIVKIIGKKPKEILKPSIVEITNPIGKVYGEFRNQLVMEASDIKIID